MPYDAQRFLTLFVDASFCPRTLAAGWGAWAVRRSWGGGRFRSGPVSTSLEPAEAEIKGIANALLIFHQEGALNGIDQVMVQSDCARALQVLCHSAGAIQRAKEYKFDPINRKLPTLGEMLAVDRIVTLLEGRQLDVRHVYGHEGRSDGRRAVNTECDALARREMQKMRGEMPGGKKMNRGANRRLRWQERA